MAVLIRAAEDPSHSKDILSSYIDAVQTYEFVGWNGSNHARLGTDAVFLNRPGLYDWQERRACTRVALPLNRNYCEGVRKNARNA